LIRSHLKAVIEHFNSKMWNYPGFQIAIKLTAELFSVIQGITKIR